MGIEQMCCPFPKRYGQKTKMLEHKLEGSTGQARAFGQAQHNVAHAADGG